VHIILIRTYQKRKACVGSCKRFWASCPSSAKTTVDKYWLLDPVLHRTVGESRKHGLQLYLKNWNKTVVKINIKGYKCCNDEANVKVVLGEGEHRDADVAEDEILGQKVEELEKLLSSSPRIHREIIVRVVGLTHPTEKHSHNAWKGFFVLRKKHSQDI